jgi:hypothetical protein
VKTVVTLGIGMMIGSATLAAAAPSTIQAVISNFKIVVNNEQAKLNNSPIVSDGVTYLPVREVAGLLDADVKYDGKNKQISLNSKGDNSVNTTTTEHWISLTDLNKIVDEVTLGPLGENKNVLQIKQGDLSIQIPNVVSQPDGEVNTLPTLTGDSVDIKSLNNQTFLGIDQLKKLGLKL